jgi:phospholipid/cholesterol/gamma-HCH transport system ATP-binding protein
VVTHDLDSTFKIADRVTVLDKGEVLFVGTPAALRAVDNMRIQNLLHRRPEDEPPDPEAYLDRLTAEPSAGISRRAPE